MWENEWLLMGISTVFAAIPAAIWLYIIFKKSERSKKTAALIFILGCFTAPALLGIQYVWEIFPEFDLASFIEKSIETPTAMFIAMFVLFAAMEEIIKLLVIGMVDKKTMLIRNINDAIRYSFAAALGFSFAENVYYLYQFWPQIGTGDLIGMYLFRSIFTTCAHLIFSGIFGYFYGIGKFSIFLSEQEKLLGKKNSFARIIAKIFDLPLTHAYQQAMVVRGLITAIFLHATYNYLLQYNILIPDILFVIIGFIYLRYLLTRKTGHLVLTTDISKKRKSNIAHNDKEVVIELMGMWFNEGKYEDVFQICENLLERDPDNEVVKIFKAKAEDEIQKSEEIRELVGKKKQSNKNIITKSINEKKNLEKVKKLIESKLKKEGKAIKDITKKHSGKSKKGPVDSYTGDGSFKL